jgi:hypothetical protein
MWTDDEVGAHPKELDGSVWHGTLPASAVGAILGAIVAAPLGWLGAGGIYYTMPAQGRGLEQGVLFALVAVLAAAPTGALLAGFALRHPLLVIPEIALIAQALGIVLFLFAIGMAPSRSGLAGPILIVAGPLGAAPVAPYVVLGAIVGGILFRYVGHWLVSPKSAQAVLNRDSRDGTRLAWTMALTAGWYVAGAIMLVALFPNSQGY